VKEKTKLRKGLARLILIHWRKGEGITSLYRTQRGKSERSIGGKVITLEDRSGRSKKKTERGHLLSEGKRRKKLPGLISLKGGKARKKTVYARK